MNRKFSLVVLIAELLLLAAMLLADFGVLKSSIDPLSTKSIMLHVTVVILIIGSAIGYFRAGK